MHNHIVLKQTSRALEQLPSVLEMDRVGFWQGEVAAGKVVDGRIDLADSHAQTVFDKCASSDANAQSTALLSVSPSVGLAGRT